MKRSGNHDLSSGNGPKARAARTKSQTAAALMATATASASAVPPKASSSPQKSKIRSNSASSSSPSSAEDILAHAKNGRYGHSHKAASAAALSRAKRANVFEQFSAKYVASPFDVEFAPSDEDLDFRKKSEERERDGTKRQRFVDRDDHGGRNSGSGSEWNDKTVKSTSAATSTTATTSMQKPNKMNSRLVSLLHDDTGEQEMELYKDDSPEAAQQVADFKTYFKMSEEARRKANAAVSVAGLLEEDLELDAEDASSVTALEQVSGTKKKGVRVQAAAGTPSSAKHDGKASLRTTSSAEVVSSERVSLPPPRKRRVRATVKETGSDSMANYIKSLGQHELLYKEDEILLGRQVRMLTLLEEKRRELEEEMLRPPTYAQWAAATNHTVPSLKQQIRRSQRAKAALIEANLRLVITVARQAVKKSPHQKSKQSASSVQFQDACQQGIIGLTRATEKFDPELGFRFSTYAIWWIQKEVAKNVSEQSRTVRLPANAIKKINDIRIHERVLMNELGRRPRDEELAEKCGMTVEKLNFYRSSAKEVGSLDKKLEARTGKGSSSTGGINGGDTMEKFVKDTEHPSPAELVDQEMMKEDIRRLVKTLSPREQAVIRLRFGLDDGKPQTLGDIGAKFGVEKERIKKIEARALLKLRQPSRSQVVKCYVSDHT